MKTIEKKSLSFLTNWVNGKTFLSSEMFPLQENILAGISLFLMSNSLSEGMSRKSFVPCKEDDLEVYLFLVADPPENNGLEPLCFCWPNVPPEKNGMEVQYFCSCLSDNCLPVKRKGWKSPCSSWSTFSPWKEWESPCSSGPTDFP